MARTLDDLIAESDAAFAAARQHRATLREEAKAILDGARAGGRANVTLAESQRLGSIRGHLETVAGQITRLAGERRQLDEIVAEETTVTNLMNTRTPADHTTAARPAYDRVARVGAEARTYHAGHDPNGRQFALDVCRSALGHMDSQERLFAHMREEQVERGQYLQRATGTGAYAGLVVPQYLTDLAAPAVANLRPTANIAHKRPLPPDGMTLNISKITTPSSTALQATENSAVSEQDMDDTLLTVNVQTAAGQQTISRQALERGSGVEDITVSDLVRRYATTLDNTILNQATTGLSAIAQSTTYTDASPTGAELYPSIFKAQSLLETALRGVAVPDYLIMHPRRWNWMCSELTTAWPLIGGGSAPSQNAGITLTTDSSVGVRGVLNNGLKIVVDANVATTKGGGTEDEIFIVASQELFLFEDPDAPVYIRAEQAAASSLGVLLVVYGYFAYAVRYTNGVGKIGGTGLSAPSGF